MKIRSTKCRIGNRKFFLLKDLEINRLMVRVENGRRRDGKGWNSINIEVIVEAITDSFTMFLS